MDYDKFKNELKKYDDWDNAFAGDVISFPGSEFNLNIKDDRVNSPSHYTKGSQEVIVTIEEAIEDAPSVTAGMLQAQVLKYMLRVWLKDNPVEDLKKAQWYLSRLIDKLGPTTL